MARGAPAPASRARARRGSACASLIAAALGLHGCGAEAPHGYTGYAEADYVRVAAPFGGRLEALAVERGAQVAAGERLFVLEHDSEAAARREAEARLHAAEARLANLLKGRRAPELDAIRAQLAQAEAALKLAAAQLARTEQLVQARFLAPERLDEARAEHGRAAARVAELEAQLATAQLAAREDEIRSAAHEVAAARAALAQAEWRLAQKTVAAPVAGLVQDLFYVAGEWVGAGAPVVSLLPPKNVKVRFYVPEPALGALRLGQEVLVRCDGCPEPVRAKVSFISPRAEYTPPVIFSREERAKLVYLVEARPAPEDAAKLHPGQPVEVSLSGEGAQAR
jgi:HlyD family secretion protein